MQKALGKETNKERGYRMSEGIKAWEVAGNVAERAYSVGKATVGFVMERLTVGGWGSTADAIQPPHVSVEPERGTE